MELVDGVDVVRGHAIWNIMPGEIARRIKESELEDIEKLKGIIIQEGCSALVFANGELVANLSSGAYKFFKSVEEEKAAIQKAIEAAEKVLDEKKKKELAERRCTSPTFRELGIMGEIGQAFRWVGHIIFGEKKSDRKERIEKNKIDYARILANATRPPVMSVYVVSNRNVPMTFGGSANIDEKIDFCPYKIGVGIQDVEIGVSLQMRVNDIHAITTNYLADRTSFTTSTLFSILNPIVETTVSQALRNVEYEETGLAPELCESLKQQIIDNINSAVYGIECVQVVSITNKNADFERFRNIERQLYNSEKELDYMHRTGEFRNRMEIEANSQTLSSARNAEELRHSMMQLNRDQLINDAELEDFVRLYESQRRLKDATTQEEEYEALQDLKKNRLVKDDEIEQLEADLAQKKIPRNEIIEIMRIRSQQNVDTAMLKAEWAIDDSRQDHDWMRADLERRRNWGIEDEEAEREWAREQKEYDRARGRERDEDEYDFQKFMRRREIEREDHLQARSERLEDERLEYERERQSKFDDDTIEANRHQRNMDKLQAMAEMQARLDAQQQQHEQNLATIHANEQMNRDNNYTQMSAEQIRAAQLSHLSAEAQVAMANSYGSEKEAEILRSTSADKENMMQQMLRMQQENSAAQMAAMMQMAGMIKDTATNVSGAVNAAAQQQTERLQANLDRQQDRMEHLQDVSINNLANVSNSAAANIGAYNGGAYKQPTAQMQLNQPAVPTQTPSSEPTADVVEFECYNCGHTVRTKAGAPSCPDCGAPFQW